MEPVAGALIAPILIGSTAYANHLTSTYGALANFWAGAINIAGWMAQFVGHGVFEGRAPALLDNLVQAAFLAPFFVWLEVLFSLGYRPELKHRIDQAIEKEVSQLETAKKDLSDLKDQLNEKKGERSELLLKREVGGLVKSLL